MKQTRPPRVMIVDDDIDYLEMVEYASQNDGTFFVIQKGALSALKHLGDVNYDIDIIITDLAMAEIDGITFTEQVRRNENIRRKIVPIEIYWLTGWDYHLDDPNDPITKAAKDNKVKEIISKPVDFIELVEKIT